MMVKNLRYFERLPKDKKIFIYGAGSVGDFVFDNLTKRGFAVAGFIDSSKSGVRQGLAVSTLAEYAPTHDAGNVVVIASSYHHEILASLEAAGVADAYDAWPAFVDRQVATGMLFHSLPDGFDIKKWSDDKLQTLDVVETIARRPGAPKPHRLAVNIGCNDGKHGDPCYPLFAAGYGGLCVDVIDTPKIYENLPDPAVIKHMGYKVSPMNVAGLLRDAELPVDFDLLKIDIDSIDGPVLCELLKAGYRPNVIQMEVNNDIPPPFKFAVLYHRLHYTYDSVGQFGFYGCSLGFVEDVAARYGYELLQLDFLRFRDAIFVKKEFMPLFEPRPFADSRQAFLQEPCHFTHMFNDLGIDTRSWRHREDYHLLAGDIWSALMTANHARFGVAAPFHFSL
jgi:hypothetical protein